MVQLPYFGSLGRISCGDLMVQLPYFGSLSRITVSASRRQYFYPETQKIVIVYHPIRKGKLIVVLPSAKLILPVDRGIFTSGGIFLIKLNQFITKKKFS